ncbi:MAG: molybdopterin-synthase adenylyltransferase MoeB [Candidatus Sumerlaeaceae bacterium]|nr:molybdopterin-synthase adenylyltransferase MoeB [Candidatus Sumerlaeaceae bacterium]
MDLSSPQQARYMRQVILAEIGEEGQKRLLSSRVLLVGAGGLGSPAALYLAAAGVGTLGIVDSDVVDATNLHRQILHGTSTVGIPKLESARQRLAETNPDTRVEPYETRLDSSNALEIIKKYDIVIDGTDNFPTRYLVNDACVFLRKPNVYGAIQQFEGQASLFHPAAGGPCYRCLFPEPPPPGLVPSCAEAGVLGVLPGIIGLIQATEAVKLIIGAGRPLMGRLLMYDAMEMSFREVRVRRNPDCPVCGENPSITTLIDYEGFCRGGCSTVAPFKEVTVSDLAARMATRDNFVLIDVRNDDEYSAGAIEGSRLIPLPVLKSRLGELEDLKHAEVIVHCKMGGRSAQACQILADSGFTNVSNLKGGYMAWVGRKP